jgi:hypothetical protein
MNTSASLARAKQGPRKNGSSKRTRGTAMDDPPEYDFSKMKLVQGKYFHRYWAGRSIVRLSPDVAAVFPDDESVNNALRMLIKVAKAQTRRARAKTS